MIKTYNFCKNFIFIVFLSYSQFTFSQESNFSSNSFLTIKKHIEKNALKYRKGDCLKLNTEYETGYSEVKVVESYTSYGEPEFKYESRPYQYQVQYLYNNCSHPIFVKGIRKYVNEQNNYVYEDVSFVVEPNYQFKKFGFNDYYNEDSEDEYQYFENFNSTNSSTSSASSAQKLAFNTYEVDSFTKTTNLNIKKGDKITIVASGYVRLGDFAGTSDPNGIKGFEMFSEFESLPHGSLVARIGISNWFFVGTNKTFIADNDGILQFKVNDVDRTNNKGSYIVELSINNNNNGILNKIAQNNNVLNNEKQNLKSNPNSNDSVNNSNKLKSQEEEVERISALYWKMENEKKQKKLEEEKLELQKKENEKILYQKKLVERVDALQRFESIFPRSLEPQEINIIFYNKKEKLILRKTFNLKFNENKYFFEKSNYKLEGTFYDKKHELLNGKWYLEGGEEVIINGKKMIKFIGNIEQNIYTSEYRDSLYKRLILINVFFNIVDNHLEGEFTTENYKGFIDLYKK